jgi:predicted DNA-binding WGR domain protein
VIADLVRDDGRVFTHAGADPSDIWWEVSLSWMLATRLLGELAEALDEHMPILARLYYGQRRNPNEQVTYLEKAGTFWEITFDPAAAVMATRFGKIGTAGSTTVERVSLASARALVEAQIAEKKQDGYREVQVAATSKVVAKKPAAKAKVAAKTKVAARPVAKPAAKKPVKKIAAKKPAAKKPAAKKPAAKKPAAKKPAAKKSAAKKSAAKPTAKRS